MKIVNCKLQIVNWVNRTAIIWFAALLAVAISISGCAEKAAEPERTAHPTGWKNPADTANFHGTFLNQRGIAGRQACRDCHGADNSAAATGVSCFGCHDGFPHPAGWASPTEGGLHQTKVQQLKWDLSSCKDCHGADYRTAKLKADSTTTTCFECHTGNSGPQGCRTCHGGTNSSAPPPDLLGGTGTDLITVGAHTAHVSEEGTFARIACAQCHSQFAGFADPAHIDTTTPGMAEVSFGVVATDSGRVSPSWNRETGTCSSVYCHGSFDGGTAWSPVWTTAGLPQGCSSCHGQPPSTHTAPAQQGACSACHSFTQETHVDGTVNFR